ncbi:MAG: hypothetical protein U0531_03480 [Dehalococcoidia bacterium]
MSAGLGLWLMAAPAVLDYGARARTNDRIVGPLVAAFAVVATWEVMRGLRRVESALGLWLLVGPWLLRFPLDRALMDLAVGALLVMLASRGGRLTGQFGGGWRALWRPAPALHDTGSARPLTNEEQSR